MKVIIIEVTRAANSFTRTHLPEIRQAYDLIAKIVRDAQATGDFRADIDPEFASMWFYGAIEQLLSGWVFEIIPDGDGDFDRARAMVVETICGGLESGARERPPLMVYCPGRAGRRPDRKPMDNEIVKRLMWTGLVAGTGALASVVAMRVSAADLAAGLRRGPAGVSVPAARAAAGRGPLGRRAGLRRLRARLDPRPRGDRARQDRGLREGHTASLRGGGRRHRRRRLRLPRPDPADARDRLAARRPLLRRPRLGRLPDRGRGLLRRSPAIAGHARLRAVQEGAPPTPEMAIEEGKRIRQTLESGDHARRPRSRPLAARGTQTEPEPSSTAAPASRSPAAPPARPGARSAEIRADIERQREELSHSVEALRGRVTELTDWRRQVREHRRELVIGAAVVGFASAG